MKEYIRDCPLFSLCGLNCGLCPRYQTTGKSKCPGCGGPDFHLQHPTCAVITCNSKHDNVEFCFQCSEYPCDRYRERRDLDSFITYKNVMSDFEKVRTEGIDAYRIKLDEKVSILEFLMENFNDGRRKNFYCLAVNLLNYEDLLEILEEINADISKQDIELKEKIAKIVMLFEKKAQKDNIELKLRKPG